MPASRSPCWGTRLDDAVSHPAKGPTVGATALARGTAPQPGLTAPSASDGPCADGRVKPDRDGDGSDAAVGQSVRRLLLAAKPVRAELWRALRPLPAAVRMSAAGFMLRIVLASALLVPCALPPPAFSAGSGGYSRPGGYGTGGASIRRPSTLGSGGYARPSGPPRPSYGGTRGPGDAAISRRSSARALEEFRSSTAPPPSSYGTRRPSIGSDSGWWGSAQRRPEPQTSPGGFWGQSRTASPFPQPYAGAPQRFGAWDAVMLWSLLNAVSTPRSTDFFREHRTDPGYLQWRAEADRLAASDPAMGRKLAELDQRLAQGPSDRAAAPSGQGSGIVPLVLVVGVAIFLGLWLRRRRAAGMPAPGRQDGPAGITGSARTRFRIGMTIPLDPAPFVLAGGATKVIPPAEGALVSIEAVGLISDGTGTLGSVALHRLYLPGRSSFFLLHLGRSGQPDECRYFSLLDQVTPATGDDWAFWLDPAQGMIGWPEFQTKDGKLYGRAWAPGSTRVPPRDQTEIIRDTSGDRSRTLHAMLYAGPTGAAPPAPDTEYILVAAIEQDGQAWVEIHAGIDINPAALSLPPVPFA